MRMNWDRGERNPPERLADGATVVVVGGGPAGAFFALCAARESRAAGLNLRIIVLEQRRDFIPLLPASAGMRRGCNYCAGGLSPRMNDLLHEMGLSLPAAVIQNEIQRITVQSYWKNIEFRIPPGRRMLAVYRGSLPAHRHDGCQNLDGFLLAQALREGSLLYEAEATDLTRLGPAKIRVGYRDSLGEQALAADFVAVAAGVNQGVGHRLESSRLAQSVRRLLPAYQPPRLRRTLIFELELDKDSARELEGDIFFVEYGSKTLPLEMCSLCRKDNSSPSC
jgi:2-polyprenyl-6-methoxyphenol hydroxylase-like FAD-dependent oxidoreductase